MISGIFHIHSHRSQWGPIGFRKVAVSNTKEILLVDDEAIIALNTANMLKSYGYQVVTSLHGDDALHVIEKDDVDLVLMDIDLGEKRDGADIAKEMLAKKNIPIVFYTSHIEKEMIEKTRQITRFGYVLKSSGDYVLVASIEMAFELYNAYRLIRENEERYHHVSSLLTDYAFQLRATPDGILKRAWTMGDREKVTGVPTPGTNVQKEWRQICHPEDCKRLDDLVRSGLAGKKTLDVIRIVDTEGRIRWIEIMLDPVWSAAEQRVTEIYGYKKNITALKNAEEETARLIQEKDLLIREVHHRIKNNMTTIAGLLSLQSERVEDERAAASLLDARNRVQGMILIYEQLFRSQKYREIDMGTFLTALIDSIRTSHLIEKGCVSIEGKFESVILPIKKAFPLGIIAAELLSNAIKHAFTDTENKYCVIRVSLTCEGEREAVFIVGDNGKGFSQNLVAPINGDASSGFGLEMVKLLVKQFHGTIDMTSREGLEFRIGIPL